MSLLWLLNVAGYMAAGLTLATFFMRDDIRLRQVALTTNVATILYGLAAHTMLPVFLHATLLPLNVWRLREYLRDKALIESAVETEDISAQWLMQFMEREHYEAGSVLFRRGDAADRMYFIASGRVLLVEIGVELESGALLGEIALFSPAGTRTQTARAVEDSLVYTLRRQEVLALYRRNPTFGIYLIRLITRRLVEDLAIERASPSR